MKFLGIILVIVGVLAVAAGFILTPAHSFNVVDSNSGLDTAAGQVYGGLIVFGVGLVLYMTSVPYAGQKKIA